MRAQYIADVLVSAWTLAERDTPLPTGTGVLDRALKTAIEEGAFPQFKDELRFVRTRVGVRCAQLESILSWAQASGQTSDPNSSYEVTEMKTSKHFAQRVLAEHQIDPELACTWGRTLSKAIEKDRSVQT